MLQIGIVIPVYNGERYLVETLESVLAQTFVAWELVIVDDGSTDSSGAIAAAFAARDSRISIVHMPNGGVAAARNAGLSYLQAGCDFISFLDQDDVWYPNTLDTLRRALLDDPAAAGAHGMNRLIDSEGRPAKPRGFDHLFCRPRMGFSGSRLIRWPADAPTTFSVVAFWFPVATPGQVLLRRAALMAAGEFDPTLSGADDWDMWFRLTQNGYLVYLDWAVIDYRRHTANISARSERMAAVTDAMLRKRASAPDLTPEQRRLLRQGTLWRFRVVAELRWHWAMEHWTEGRYWLAAKEVRHTLKAFARFYAGFLRRQ